MQSSPNHSVEPYHLHNLFVRCEGAYSQNTLRGYRNDLKVFKDWCRELGHDWLPALPEAIADFIDDQAKTKAMATLKHRLDAIRFAHRMADLPSPTENSNVRLAYRRARRAKPARQEQALGLTHGLLAQIVAACPDTLAGRRDAALFSVGYDTLCRSSELAALRVENLEADWSRICVPRSKADPFGKGRNAYLSHPTRARLAAWLEASGLVEGPLFRGLHCGRVATRALATSSLRRMVKRAATRAHVDPEKVRQLSSHSMRVGAAQDMLVAGIDMLGIMQAGGWKSQSVLARYVENASVERLHQLRWQRLALLA
ncbi:tyrosine-type recombinase/integrase [Qipengyuania sp. CAU 1752]